MRESGGKKPDKKQFFKLFEPTWRKAATVETAQSGFRETGTFPLNRQAINPEVFEPSRTSERQLESVSEVSLTAETSSAHNQAVSHPATESSSCQAVEDISVGLQPALHPVTGFSSFEAVVATPVQPPLHPVAVSSSDEVVQIVPVPVTVHQVAQPDDEVETPGPSSGTSGMNIVLSRSDLAM
jgi:hypothetical protein